MTGSFETERQARESAAQASGSSYRLLLSAVVSAGVFPGAYDYQVIQQLARLEPSACAAVAGLIDRAARRRVPS